MLRHTTLCLTVGFLLGVGSAQAHFVFIVPQSKDSTEGKVVFSDAPEPDGSVDITKIDSSKLTLIREDGKNESLDWKLKKKEGSYAIMVPGSGTRHVLSSTDYGVLRRGDAEPFWLKYHGKAIFGPVAEGAKQVVLEGTPLELVPVVEGKKIRFRAFFNGKPFPKAPMRIHVPGEEKAVSAMADETGLSPEYEKSGKYAVTTWMFQEKSGVRVGQKYAEVRDYATLVAIFGE